MTDSDNCFDVRVDVWLSSTGSQKCAVAIKGDWGASNSSSFELEDGENMATVWVKAQNVKLWWPNGYGMQNLHDIDVTVDCGKMVTFSSNVFFVFRIRERRAFYPPPKKNARM